MRTPDFFIVGAPKCGTTALYSYLRQHPDVFMPEVKEPHRFAPDLGFNAFQNQADYLSLFAEAVHEKRVGEASVWYLYSQAAPAAIKEFRPDARIIIMLRNPVEMIYSLHSQAVYSGHENIADFEAALQAEEDRKHGLRVPRHVAILQFVLYRETGRYTEHVKRYFDVFGRENVQVLIFEDLKQNASQIYEQTCQFLDIAADFHPEFEVVNPNTARRSMALVHLIGSPTARKMGRLLMPFPAARQHLASNLDQLNTKVEPRPPMNPQLRQRLQAEFAPETEHLSELLGRDLVSIWR